MGWRAAVRAPVFVLAVAAAGPASAQFLETFDGPQIATDPDAAGGWAFFTGAGAATMRLVADGEGHASILVDATRDRRGVWWALIKRKVSERIDLALLSRPGHELRVEARIRVSHAPRRVNLHVNTQRTTDFHSHLMEFDIPDTTGWHTISMTTRGFSARPGDSVYAQLALMDWGPERYRVDVDSFRVDVIEAARAGPDLGEPLPYHPPVADPAAFRCRVEASEDAVVDLDEPDANLAGWAALDGTARAAALTASGRLRAIARFDLAAWAGRRVSRAGLLELTTRSVLRGDATDDFGVVRVVEILGGDRAWRRATVTLSTLLRGEPIERVFNGQPVIDWPVTEGAGRTTLFTIPRPVLQRLVDGRTAGLAVEALGSICASFRATGSGGGPRLLFDVDG